ncbi:MAG: hypothetical protein ABIF01_01265 [Candidatus Micrarchaeota archaeon]
MGGDLLKFPSLYALALAFSFLSSMAFADLAPQLSYSATYQQFRPWARCSPIGDTYKACFYNGHSVVLGSAYPCMYDAGSSVYFTSTISFSFTTPRKANASISLGLYECAYSPRWLTFRVNGICDIPVENTASGGMNRGLAIKTIPIPSNCLLEGQNTMAILGGDIFEFSLGSGQCPSLSCLGAPLYADFTIPEQSIQLLSNGSVSTNALVSNYSFNLSIPAGTEGSFSLPQGTVLTSCPECSLQGGTYTIGPGNHSVNYLIENLRISISYPNIYSAFLSNETPKVNITTSHTGSPIQSKVYFENHSLACDATAGFCELTLPETEMGSHHLNLFALESNIGRRGIAELKYYVESEPEVKYSEASDGSFTTATYELINPTHLEFSKQVEYTIPDDIDGSYSITPMPQNIASNATHVSFIANCPQYSNCTYKITTKSKGVSVLILPPSFPRTARVGEAVIGTGEVILTNTNSKRSMNSRGLVPDCSGSCSWDLSLAPGETRRFSYSVNRPGAIECGREQLSTTSSYESSLRICLQIPENFPIGTSHEYSAQYSSLPDYSKGLEARISGVSVGVSLGMSSAIASLGILAPGEHYLLLTYIPKNEVLNIEPVETGETDEVDETKDEVEQSNTAPVAPEIIMVVPERAGLGEVVQVTVLSGESPATGEITITSPNGKISPISLSNGQAFTALDELGEWTVSYSNKERTIQVEPRALAAMQETEKLQNDFGPTYTRNSNAQPIGFEFGPWVSLLLLLPLLAMPALGYFLFTVSRSPPVRVLKRYDGMEVTIEIENCGGPLTDIWVSDSLPDDAVIGNAGGGSFKKTIFGNVLKWRIPTLNGATKWGTSYELRTTAKVLGETKIQATEIGGNHIKASSGETEMSAGQTA